MRTAFLLFPRAREEGGREETRDEKLESDKRNSSRIECHCRGRIRADGRDEKLSVRTFVSGLDAPSTMAFIGANDILVTEKKTGKVQRVAGGVVAGLYEIFRVR